MDPQLEEIASILVRHGLRAWVDTGTLLGLVRDGRLIPHDGDIDLVVTDPDLVGRAEELQDVACACPMCNTISAATPIRSEVRIRLGAVEPAAAPA